MTQPGGVGAQPPDACHPRLVGGQRRGEVRRVRAVDHVVARVGGGRGVDGLDRRLQRRPRGEAAVGLDRERDRRRHAGAPRRLRRRCDFGRVGVFFHIAGSASGKIPQPGWGHFVGFGYGQAGFVTGARIGNGCPASYASRLGASGGYLGRR